MCKHLGSACAGRFPREREAGQDPTRLPWPRRGGRGWPGVTTAATVQAGAPRRPGLTWAVGKPEAEPGAPLILQGPRPLPSLGEPD